MKKYDIILVDLNPIQWSEQSGIRPCIIIQNNYANPIAKTYVVAILSTRLKEFPHTLIIQPSSENKLSDSSRIDLLQVRTIDKMRIIKNIWSLDIQYQQILDHKIKIAFWL